MRDDHPAPPAEPVPTLVALKSLPRPVWILFAGTFLNKFGTFVVPFLTIYLTRRGFSTTDAAIAIGAYGVGQLIAAFWGGHLADTIGRRKTIVLSMFSVAVAMLLLSQASSLPAIIVFTGLAGLTGELYRPASSALLADLVPPHLRVTAYAAYRMMFNAGWAFGPATAGFVAQHSMTWLFVGDAVTSVLFGIVAWAMLPRGVQGQVKEARWTEALITLKRDSKLHQVLLASIVIGLVFHQMGTTYGLHVTTILKLPDATYGILLSLNGLLVVLCELPVTTFTRRWPARKMMALGYALAGGGFALNAFAGTAAELALAMTVFTFGEMIMAPVTAAYIADLAPANMRGRYMGSWAFTSAFAQIVGPGLGLWAFGRSPFMLWIACGAAGLAAAAIILPRRPRTTVDDGG